MRIVFNFLLFILFLFLFSNLLKSQAFNGNWVKDYVTPYNSFNFNSIGERVISVGVFHEDSFFAFVIRLGKENYYIVSHKDANREIGRLETFLNSPTNKQTLWVKDFSQTKIFKTKDLATRDSLVFVPNIEIVNKQFILIEKPGASVSRFLFIKNY